MAGRERGNGPRSRKRIAYYLRDPANLHYFAGLKAYLDHFVAEGAHENRLVVRGGAGDFGRFAEYRGYTHLVAADDDLDAYDLVLTPTFLRSHERTDRTRAIQIFHGMSDKPFTYERDFSDYALCLCVGLRQVERLLRHRHNRTMKFAVVGYPKFDRFPSEPKAFRNDKPTVIYCPTWRKGGLSSVGWLIEHPEVVAEILEDYNLMVKPHPNTLNPNREYYDASIVGALRELQGVKLIHSGNVMPWLAQASLFLGDISASGYEWLYFDRPMVFLNPRPGELWRSRDVGSLTYLWQCGDVCEEPADLKSLIDRNLAQDSYHATREEILHYSVFHPRSGEATARGVQKIDAVLGSL